MNYTNKLNLKKPETTEPILIGDLNDNADILDSVVSSKYSLADSPQSISNNVNIMTLPAGVYAKAQNVNTLTGTPADFSGTNDAFLLVVRIAFYASSNPWRRQFLLYPTGSSSTWQDKLVYRCTETNTAGSFTDWVRFPDGQTVARRTSTS